MGYQRKLYHLTWPEDHDLHGLEVTTKGLSVERLFRMAELLQRLDDAAIAEQVEITKELFGQFARCLVEWNLEDEEDEPVPITAEAVAEQDVKFMLGLVMAWMDAVAGVGNPLPQPSSNGHKPPEELTLGLGALSESLPS